MTKTPSPVAVVTGSTQGLGEAIARQLIDERLIRWPGHLWAKLRQWPPPGGWNSASRGCRTE